MRRRIRNVIQIEVEGVSLEGATDLEFYIRQGHGLCRCYVPTIIDNTHIEVDIPYEDAMKFMHTTASIQLAFTNMVGYPVATEIETIPVRELLKEEGYD